MLLSYVESCSDFLVQCMTANNISQPRFSTVFGEEGVKQAYGSIIDPRHLLSFRRIPTTTQPTSLLSYLTTYFPGCAERRATLRRSEPYSSLFAKNNLFVVCHQLYAVFSPDVNGKMLRDTSWSSVLAVDVCKMKIPPLASQACLSCSRSSIKTLVFGANEQAREKTSLN